MNNWKKIEKKDNKVFTTPLPDKDFLLKNFDKSVKILDLGCGYGRVTEYLFDLGYKDITGIDISKGYIDHAKARNKSINYICGDIEDTSWLSAKFDLIIIMGVIEYIVEDNAQKEFFRNVKNLLTPKGTMLLETFTIDYKNNLKNYLFDFAKYRHWGKFLNSGGFECHHQTHDWLIENLSKIFSEVKGRKVLFNTWSDVKCNGSKFIAKY